MKIVIFKSTNSRKSNTPTNATTELSSFWLFFDTADDFDDIDDTDDLDDFVAYGHTPFGCWCAG